MVITGSIYFTGAIVILVGGLYWKRASRAGAMAALLAGATAILGLEPVRHACIDVFAGFLTFDAPKMKQELTSSIVGLFSLGLTTSLFVIVSLCKPDRCSELEEDQHYA